MTAEFPLDSNAADNSVNGFSLAGDAILLPPSRSPQLQHPLISDRPLSNRSTHHQVHHQLTELFQQTLADSSSMPLPHSGRLELSSFLARGDRIALTTKTLTIHPLFFPGGDLGSLAVNSAVNQLAVAGAIPLYLSCNLFIDEDLAITTIQQLVQSMKRAADMARVRIVTGDVQVLAKNNGDRQGDRAWVAISGIGSARSDLAPSSQYLQPGDAVLLSGPMGDHSIAMLLARGDLNLAIDIRSDSRPLHDLTAALGDTCSTIRAMSTTNRGGVAAALNELAQASRVAIRVENTQLPIHPAIIATCDLLGLNPIHLDNEGVMIAVVPAEQAAIALAALRSLPEGSDACQIGCVLASETPIVTLRNSSGIEQLIDPSSH
ncbi:MAG: hydrogenase expression/formation protein HypE [Oscillatoriales cyanobacterium]|nr:MAG: hydrogenase expression/formation protein HypE [Oscillatoriales cyanobacterium]